MCVLFLNLSGGERKNYEPQKKLLMREKIRLRERERELRPMLYFASFAK